MRLFVLLLTMLLAAVFSPNSVAQTEWHVSEYIEAELPELSRHYRVSLPADYQDNSARQYPLLLILDGQRYGDLVAGNARFLSGIGEIPAHVIVAVDAVNRLRDYTPTDSPDWDGDGGAQQFMQFLTTQLMPRLTQQYRLDSHKIIWGHSAAGLYVMHHLYTAPTTFDAYLVNDGSLGWDNQFVATQLEKYLDSPSRPAQYLYFNNSFLLDDVPDEAKFIAPIKALLNAKAGASLRWDHQNLSDESHASIPLTGSIKALRALYAGYRIPEKVVYAGLDAMTLHLSTYRGRLGALTVIPENNLLDLGFHALQRTPQESIEVFDYCVSLYPQSLYAFDGLSHAYAATGQTDEALRALNQAIEIATRVNPEELARLKEQKSALLLNR
ncbi:alpha/beta hydrolase-fold protein [Alteromonas gilva]|uniref:Alpha/beta hydrolase-fold protein n=1 Tax=Alteromonas gilva TaxID=2987522 RepID=A0ABT5L388_9ALTE|nr:alpha/beta hydrolase-fold protein [Alteromonas gilva]MDC8831515.1 alpha/beta hydrolase-fold protein [Alteromonas gilva]